MPLIQTLGKTVMTTREDERTRLILGVLLIVFFVIPALIKFVIYLFNLIF